MMGMRRAGLGVAALAMVGFVGAGAAFACSVLPKVSSVSPESGAPGETVQVAGEVRTAAPVEIRWNGVGGQVLAVSRVGADGLLSVPVRIPDVTPGIYSLTVVTTDAGVARTAVEVTAPGGSLPAATPQLWPSVTGQPLDASASNGVSPLGVALLGVGLVGLFAGTTMSVSRTRRVPAGPRA